MIIKLSIFQITNFRVTVITDNILESSRAYSFNSEIQGHSKIFLELKNKFDVYIVLSMKAQAYVSVVTFFYVRLILSGVSVGRAFINLL